jgi:hypothetical protein
MTTWRMRIAWGYKQTSKHSQYEYLLLLHWNGCCSNAPQWYLISITSVLSIPFLHHYAGLQKVNNLASLDIIGVKFRVIVVHVLRLREHQWLLTCVYCKKAWLMSFLYHCHTEQHSAICILGTGGLETKSQGDECVLSRHLPVYCRSCSIVERCFNVRSVPSCWFHGEWYSA